MSKQRNTRSQLVLGQTKGTQWLILVCAVLLALSLIVVLTAQGHREINVPVDQNRLSLSPILGNPNAPITIVEYGAYSCSTCRAWHKAGIINQILAKYPDKVRFVFRDFPVITPRYDRMAAALSQCALDQGQELFWAFHNALYEQADVGNSQEDLIKLGGQVGLNMNVLNECAQANTYQSMIQNAENEARRLGLPGTPSFFVNDRPIYYASPETLDAAIRIALES